MLQFRRTRRLLLAAALGAAAVQATAQPALPAQAMSAQQVSPSAWYVQGLSALGSPANQNFISNAGFVVTPGRRGGDRRAGLARAGRSGCWPRSAGSRRSRSRTSS